MEDAQYTYMLIALVFLLLHFLTGVFLPSGGGVPVFYRLMFRAAREIGRRLTRKQRRGSEQKMRGAAVALFFLLMAWYLSFVVDRLATLFPDFRHALYFLCLVLCVNGMWPLKRLQNIARCLRASDQSGAVDAFKKDATILPSVGGHDPDGFARLVLTYDSLHLSGLLVAPLFWFIVLGVKGLFLSVSVHALMQAYVDKHSLGAVIRYIGRWILLLPDALTAVLYVAGAIVTPKTAPYKGIQVVLAAAPLKAGPLPLRALAGTLDVTLGGPPYDIWVGNAGTSARFAADKIQAAALMRLCGVIITMAVLSAGIVLS